LLNPEGEKERGGGVLGNEYLGERVIGGKYLIQTEGVGGVAEPLKRRQGKKKTKLWGGKNRIYKKRERREREVHAPKEKE